MKYQCKCGESISTSPSPHPDAFLLASEAVLDRAEGGAENNVASAFDICNDESLQVYRCNRCGRLLVFLDGRGTAPTFFSSEEGERCRSV